MTRMSPIEKLRGTNPNGTDLMGADPRGAGTGRVGEMGTEHAASERLERVLIQVVTVRG